MFSTEALHQPIPLQDRQLPRFLLGNTTVLSRSDTSNCGAAQLRDQALFLPAVQNDAGKGYCS